jgi:hypothetical protein
MYLIETDRPNPVPIDDLRGDSGGKLIVRPGVPVWITWEQRQASTCLRKLEALGHVRVSQGDRAREERDPPTRPVAQHVRLSRPIQRSPAPPPPEATYTKEQVDRMVEEAASKASKKTADAILGQLQSLLPSASPVPPPSSAEVDVHRLEERVEAAVAKALAKSPVTATVPGSSPKRPSGPEEPVFIPTGIVSADDNTELTIGTESSEDEGLSDAAAQLKKLRGKKPR